MRVNFLKCVHIDINTLLRKNYLILLYFFSVVFFFPDSIETYEPGYAR